VMGVMCRRGTVTYLDIHDDPAMTIGIFQLPPGARMPLHDHPGMTVFSRQVPLLQWLPPCFTACTRLPAVQLQPSSRVYVVGVTGLPICQQSPLLFPQCPAPFSSAVCFKH
jgi:hypothetical protein